MCDQTEVVYSPGDVVWVKLSPVWWPGQVYDYTKLPEEITSNLRKTPIAVVKFFQEDSFEYVKNLNSIYHYNCRKKHEFIKKGLDVIRSNNRDVPSNMKMFPNDVVTAEHLTHGNPKILEGEEFAPKEKEDYSELFGKKTPKRGKNDSAKKDTPSWRLKTDSSIKTNRHSLPTPTIPRPITHRRFITKALEGRSDHEVRIRQQRPERYGDSTSKQYNCHLCGFSSSRINVIVLHNKSHSAGNAEAYLHPQNLSGKSGKKTKGERKITFGAEKRQRSYDTGKTDEPPVKKKSTKTSKEVETRETTEKNIKLGESPVKSQLKKPIFGKKKSAKDKAEKLAREKQQNDAFRENLLKDWDDEDFGDTEDKSDNFMDISTDRDISQDSILNSSEQKSGTNVKTKETSCFDFDDSEDGIDIGETVMKFGQKIPRILGDKSKKLGNRSVANESPIKEPLTSPMKDETFDEIQESIVHEPNETHVIINANKKQTCSETLEEKSETELKSSEDLDVAFKSLLDETAVPVIPNAPTHLEIKNKSKNIQETTSHEESLIYNTNKANDDDSGGLINDGGGGGSVEDDSNSLNDRKNEALGSGKASTNDDEILSETQIINETVYNKDESCSNSEHFLVKTSEEVATSSSDDAQMENVSSPNENVASLTTGVTDCSDSEKYTEVIKEEEKIKNQESCVDINTTASHLTNTIDISFTETKTTETSLNNVNEIDLSKQNDVNSDLLSLVKSESKVDSSSPSIQEIPNFSEMEFDINSMPVIIGDDMVEEQDSTVQFDDSKTTLSTPQLTSSKAEVSSPLGNKIITVKPFTKQVSVESAKSNSSLPIVVKEDVGCSSQSATIGKDGRLSTKKLILSPTGTVTRPAQVATIKVQPTTTATINKLTVPGSMIAQKSLGSTSQVLILKSTAPGGKSTLQKLGNTSQVIQQGGKVLILTNPQGVAGQSKIISQKSLSPSKLTSTRILTTKGTVLTTGSPALVTKANLLSGSSKTVTTKSGQKILINKGGVISQSPKSVIINKSNLLTTVNSPTVISSKTPLIAQNILTSKPETLTSQVNLAQITPAGNSKSGATNIITASGLSGSNSMVLTPLAIGKTPPLTNNQKLKLITSKPGSVATSCASGAKLIVQSTQSRVILPSLQKSQQLKFVGNLKNQQNTGTILIQTSQGVIATTPLSSGQVVTKAAKPLKSTPAILSTKSETIQVTQTTVHPQNKFIVQNVKPGPNILQKAQRKPAQRNSKKSVSSGQLLTSSITSQQNLPTTVHSATINQPTLSAPQETILLPSASGIPVIGQSGVVSGTQLDSSNQTALVYLTVDDSGNYRPLESAPVINYEGTASDAQTLYIDPGTTDLDNIFLAIDDAGNVVNIARPVQNTYTSEAPTPPPSQDILAKALADTQVLQQETIVSDNSPLTSTISSSVLGGCMFVEQPAQYPQPSLSHGVLETSLTLNQPPIMTPLEVPSAVSPRTLDQISTLQTGYLNDSNLLTANKEKKCDVSPSMPLLTEDADCGATNKNETVFFTQVDGSHAVLTPVSSGSQLAFQLALDGNNVIVSSTPGLPSLGVISSSNITQSTVTPGTQVVATTDNLKPLLGISDQEITHSTFSVAKQENVKQLQHASNSSGYDSSSMTSNASENLTDQNLEHSPVQEIPPVTVSFDKENSSGGFDISESQTVENANALSSENHNEVSAGSSDNVEHVSEPVQSKIMEPCTSTELDQTGSHQSTSVINKPNVKIVNEENVPSKEDHCSTVTMDIAFSNGEVPQRIISKRLSGECADLIGTDNVSTEDGSDYKRIKLEER